MVVQSIVSHSPSRNNKQFDIQIKRAGKLAQKSLVKKWPAAKFSGFARFFDLICRDDSYSGYELNEDRIGKLARFMLDKGDLRASSGTEPSSDSATSSD